MFKQMTPFSSFPDVHGYDLMTIFARPARKKKALNYGFKINLLYRLAEE